MHTEKKQQMEAIINQLVTLLETVEHNTDDFILLSGALENITQVYIGGNKQNSDYNKLTVESDKYF